MPEGLSVNLKRWAWMAFAGRVHESPKLSSACVCRRYSLRRQSLLGPPAGPVLPCILLKLLGRPGALSLLSHLHPTC